VAGLFRLERLVVHELVIIHVSGFEFVLDIAEPPIEAGFARI
jgi:hypothetical protein